VFALLRTSPEGDESILTLTGVKGEAVPLKIPLDGLGVRDGWCRDLISGRVYQVKGKVLSLTMEPYGRVWLKQGFGSEEIL
jgi:hypothetical protein